MKVGGLFVLLVFVMGLFIFFFFYEFVIEVWLVIFVKWAAINVILEYLLFLLWYIERKIVDNVTWEKRFSQFLILIHVYVCKHGRQTREAL